MITRIIIAVTIAIVLGAPASHAQPSVAFGKPLPDATLANGTIVVRVVDGSPASPRAGATVTLIVDGVARTATTDDRGRASFDRIAAGAKVRASTTAGSKRLDSEPFVAPASGGVRVLLSTGEALPAPAAPSPRAASGEPRPSPDEAAGTIAVRVVHDDLADPAPSLVVTLVGYVADERVTIATRKTDRDGRARFTGLDRTGATAYFALALLPRGRGDVVDRLVSRPAVLDGAAGVRVLLSGDKRRSTAAAIDDLTRDAPARPVAAGKIDVELAGIPDATSVVSLFEAATGKLIASATVTAPDTRASFYLGPWAGRVLYAESAARGERLRSLPFQPTAGGTAIALHAVPRVLVRFALDAEAAEPVLAVKGSIEVQNNAWIPLRAGELPLPRGFRDVTLAGDPAGFATATATGIRLRDPLPPGGVRFHLGFALPVVNDKVRWDLELPYGAFDSSVQIARDAGMTLDAPVAPLTRDHAFVLEKIMIAPKQSMEMTIGMPKRSPAEQARARACRELAPDRRSPLRDRPMPDFTAPGLDGKPLRLSSLHGKLVVVNFTASWSGLAQHELPTFAKAIAAIPDLAVVVVASDEQPGPIGAVPGAGPPLRVVLDPPADMNADAIGPIARSWKVDKVPESFVVDRGGTVRMYLVNKRDWGSAEAIACLRAMR